jgi:hypothetical protein
MDDSESAAGRSQPWRWNHFTAMVIFAVAAFFAFAAVVRIVQRLAADDLPALRWPAGSFLVCCVLLAVSSIALWKQQWIWVIALILVAFIAATAGMPSP